MTRCKKYKKLREQIRKESLEVCSEDKELVDYDCIVADKSKLLKESRKVKKAKC